MQSALPSNFRNEELLKLDPSMMKPSSSRFERPTECKICGFLASGYHYGVPSCNSCKTFFRRISVSDEKLECQASKDCFDFTKRKKPLRCRACRHRKCFEVGMNPLSLQVDEKEASSTNYRKLMKRIYIETAQNCRMKTVALTRTLNTVEKKLQKIINTLMNLETKVEKFRLSAYNPHWKDVQGLRGLLKTECQLGYADKYGPTPGWPLKTDQLIILEPKIIGTPLLQSYHSERKYWFFYNILTNVEYAKSFKFIHQLEIEDKVKLLKSVILACLNLHVSYSAVARNSEVFMQSDESETRDVQGIMLMSIAPLIRYKIQYVEYVLLKVICLCNPAVPDLSTHTQEILSRERQKTAGALFDYCLQNRTDGPTRFVQLLGILGVLERQQRLQKDLHLLYFLPSSVSAKAQDSDGMIEIINDIMGS